MPKKPHPNITKADIGTLYTEDYQAVYRLLEYIPPAPEPVVVMQELGANGAEPVRGPLSQFHSYARLKPDREIPDSPKRKYTRKTAEQVDTGGEPPSAEPK